MTAPFRVAIADGRLMFRSGLSHLLGMNSRFKIVAEVDAYAALAGEVPLGSCDVLLLDLPPDREAPANLAHVCRHHPVLVVVTDDRPQFAVQVLSHGARGVLSKRSSLENLMEAMSAVASGRAWIPTELQGHVTAQMRDQDARLTPRQQEIVRWVAQGLRNGEIAERLEITDETVKTHLSNIFRKLHVRDRLELVLYAATHGMVRAADAPPRITAQRRP